MRRTAIAPEHVSRGDARVEQDRLTFSALSVFFSTFFTAALTWERERVS